MLKLTGAEPVMANVKRPVRILFFSPHKIVIIAILVVVVLVGVVVLAMTKPDIITIQRATEIKSPPDRIFTYINDLHNWPAWAPQDKMDITMKRNFSGGKRRNTRGCRGLRARCRR